MDTVFSALRLASSRGMRRASSTLLLLLRQQRVVASLDLSTCVQRSGRVYRFGREASAVPVLQKHTFSTGTNLSRNNNSMASSNNNPFLKAGATEFLEDAVKIIIQEALIKGSDVSSPVVEFKHPAELESILKMDVSEKPASHDVLLNDIRNIIQYSTNSGHPHFFNQLYGGLDPYSQAGAWLTESLNCNIHTYEAGPAFILAELYMVKKICGILGFENGDGLFCPGGSFSNIFALHLARFKKFPQVKEEGLYNLPRLRIYTHEDAHYSLKKAANFLGFGNSNIVLIKTDDKGRMDPRDLKTKVEEDEAKGYVPLFVMATSGSTVFGAYDPLEEISDICQQHSIWLHDDACWGGGALLSPKYRHLVKGSERCDSFAWNFHKLSGLPLQCSAFLVKEKGLMKEANRGGAEYLFQPDKFYDVSYDVGDKTVQCGRKADALKLWLQWKALGDEGMAARVEKAFDNARYLAEKIKASKGFKLVIPEFQCTNVCYWYIPPRLRNLPETDAWWGEMKDVAPKIKERMMKEGTMMIAYQPLSSKGFVNFFRIILNNPTNGHEDMDFVMSEFERLGSDL